MTAFSGTADTSPIDHGDPLARLDFSSLISGAAKLRPDRIAFHDNNDVSKSLTFAMLERRVAAMASAWRDLGLMPGERILIAATATPACIVAITGALRAGLDVAVAAPYLPAEELAEFATDTGAVALAAEPACGDLDLASELLRTAARAERVRVVAALGNTKVDGAVPLDPLRAEGKAQEEAANGSHSLHARIITRDITASCVFHRQRTIVAAALDFVTRAQIGTHIPLLSTILPASFAGLAMGPAASLIAGAPLILHGPFDSKALIAIIEAMHPVHLIAPAMLSEDFAAAGLIDPHYLASMVFLSRFKQMPADMPAEPPGGMVETTIPVIDLYAIGEIAAIAEPRLPGGARIAPLTAQHVLNLDGRDVVAARRKLHYLAANGRLDSVVAIEGAAISQGNEGDYE